MNVFNSILSFLTCKVALERTFQLHHLTITVKITIQWKLAFQTIRGLVKICPEIILVPHNRLIESLKIEKLPRMLFGLKNHFCKSVLFLYNYLKVSSNNLLIVAGVKLDYKIFKHFRGRRCFTFSTDDFLKDYFLVSYVKKIWLVTKLLRSPHYENRSLLWLQVWHCRKILFYVYKSCRKHKKLNSNDEIPLPLIFSFLETNLNVVLQNRTNSSFASQNANVIAPFTPHTPLTPSRSRQSPPPHSRILPSPGITQRSRSPRNYIASH